MVTRALSGLSGLSGTLAPLTYAFLDRFSTNAAAPLTTPRTAEPGPGALVIVDTNSMMSITGQALTFAGTNAVADRLAPAGTLARQAGRCFLFHLQDVTQMGASGGSTRIGWDTADNSSMLTYGFDFSVGSYRVKSGNGVLVTETATMVPAWYGLLMRATGALALRRAAGAGRYTVEWVYALSSAALFHKLYFATGELHTFKMDRWAVVDFAAPLTTDAGIATSITAAPASGATAVMEPDALVEFTWTVATGQTLELDIRRTDANNRWCIRCSQAGSTMKLIEIVAGVETERASSATTFTNATVHRLVAAAYGNTIKTWEGLSSTDALTAKASYTSASFNNTATGVRVAGFVTGANLIAWPRYLQLQGGV